MRDWPKRAVKWARKAVPEEITKMASEGADPGSLFDRLSERWKTEMAGNPEADPVGDDDSAPKPKRSRRTSSGK